jgi:hypothetical protein
VLFDAHLNIPEMHYRIALFEDFLTLHAFFKIICVRLAKDEGQEKILSNVETPIFLPSLFYSMHC